MKNVLKSTGNMQTRWKREEQVLKQKPSNISDEERIKSS